METQDMPLTEDNNLIKRIMLIEPDESLAKSLSDYLHKELNINTILFKSLEDAQNCFLKDKNTFHAAIINLRSCSNTYSPFDNIPTIVITDGIPLNTKKMVDSENVIDYIGDCKAHNLNYIAQLIRRINFAKHIKVIVVDDVEVIRNLVKSLLKNKGFTVLKANNGQQALKLLQDNPETKLMLIDNTMPEMDGYELVSKIRNEYSKNKLSIIGMTSDDHESHLVKFLRCGANDCILKPFRVEEFHVRVMQNLQIVEIFHEMAELTRRDFLTNLYNRRYFFDVGSKFYENYKRENIKVSIAMIDIDDFKNINDTYGHNIGDLVIVTLSKILTNILRTTDIISRFGGEEFCVLSTGVSAEDGKELFERIRQTIEDHVITLPQNRIKFTISIGVTGNKCGSLEEMINEADRLMYKAKNSGRNKVVYC